MKRKRRTEILIKAKGELIKSIVDQIKNSHDVNIIEEANNGLVMVKVRESAKKEQFYLGEVLVTEAKASVNGVLGLGIISGDHEELAESLAIIDAAYNCKIDEIEIFNLLLSLEEREILKAEQKETNNILKTKVDFSTMSI